MKYCKDCKFAKITFLDRIVCGYEYAWCTRPELQKNFSHEDMVTGEKMNVSNYYYCFTNRNSECGAEAVYFEPKVR